MGFPLMSPSTGINYNFVAGAYLVCSLILGVLFTLDKVWAVEAVEGAWIVFSPFLPASVWALAIRSKWLATRGSGSIDTAGEGVVKSKDD